MNYMKLPKREDIAKAKGAWFTNSKPDNIDLRSIPAGWGLMTWNCGRARCKAPNYALWFIPPPKKCAYCDRTVPDGMLKCPNCGANL